MKFKVHFHYDGNSLYCYGDMEIEANSKMEAEDKFFENGYDNKGENYMIDMTQEV